MKAFRIIHFIAAFGLPGQKSVRMRARFLEKLMTLLKFSDVSLAFGAMPL